MSDAILRLQGVDRIYKTGAGELKVLDQASLSLQAGQITGLVGPSGSGKSSLLHIAGLLERPDAGEVWIGGKATSGLGDSVRTGMRRGSIGFVYQFHYLLPEFDARENIALPQKIAGASAKAANARADELLDLMGLTERADHRPAQLSGGEQQRVAIARALANRPHILLADEPTGNLDPDTSDHVFNAFREAAREEGVAALVATHNHELAGRMDRVVTFDHGRIVEFSHS